jgi:single-strand DNA-binding protein
MTTTITLAGFLSRDPEVRVTPKGAKITSLSIPSNHKWGENQETTWWRASFWGDKHEKILPYLKKGSCVIVTGSLTRPPNTYVKDGQTHISALEISADMIQFAPGKKDEGQQEQKPQPAPHVYKTSATSSDHDDGDLPF